MYTKNDIEFMTNNMSSIYYNLVNIERIESGDNNYDYLNLEDEISQLNFNLDYFFYNFYDISMQFANVVVQSIEENIYINNSDEENESSYYLQLRKLFDTYNSLSSELYEKKSREDSVYEGNNSDDPCEFAENDPSDLYMANCEYEEIYIEFITEMIKVLPPKHLGKLEKFKPENRKNVLW